MIEPEVTAVLGRRSLAFLIDSALVVATGLGVAFQMSTAFPVVGRDPADEPLIDPAQFAEVEALSEFQLFGQSDILGIPLVRAQELGGSIRIFAEDSYQFGLLAAAVGALVLFGLVPAFLHRTIGMLPFGIGIRTNGGTRAGIGAHLTRTVIGFVDALPFVIPGLLGFVTSRASSHRQRLGDRVAKTVVVDLAELRNGNEPNVAIDLDLRAAPEPAPTAASTPQPAANAATAIPGPSTGFDSTSTFTEGAPTRGPSPIEALDAAERSSTPFSTPPAAEATTPPVAKPAFSDPLPPPPVHRKTPTEHHLGTPASRRVEGSATSIDAPISFEAASEVDAPTASAAEHLSAQPTLPLDIEVDDSSAVYAPDRAWEAPREEPAPVWQPTTLETAPVESPDPHNGRTIDDLERIDPSIGALLADGADQSEATDSARAGNHSKQGPSAKAPVWSDKWRAWMYWDAAQKCWLRHDTTSNTWKPVD